MRHLFATYKNETCTSRPRPNGTKSSTEATSSKETTSILAAMISELGKWEKRKAATSRTPRRELGQTAPLQPSAKRDQDLDRGNIIEGGNLYIGVDDLRTRKMGKKKSGNKSYTSAAAGANRPTAAATTTAAATPHQSGASSRSASPGPVSRTQTPGRGTPARYRTLEVEEKTIRTPVKTPPTNSTLPLEMLAPKSHTSLAKMDLRRMKEGAMWRTGYIDTANLRSHMPTMKRRQPTSGLRGPPSLMVFIMVDVRE